MFLYAAHKALGVVFFVTPFLSVTGYILTQTIIKKKRSLTRYGSKSKMKHLKTSEALQAHLQRLLCVLYKNSKPKCFASATDRPSKMFRCTRKIIQLQK